MVFSSWPISKVSDSRLIGAEFETHRQQLFSLSKTHYLHIVQVNTHFQ